MLDYSKIEAGRIELDERAFGLDALLDGCLRAVSLAAAQKGLALECKRSPGVPPVM